MHLLRSHYSDLLMDKKSQRSSAALEVKKQGGGFNHNFTREAHSSKWSYIYLKHLFCEQLD